MPRGVRAARSAAFVLPDTAADQPPQHRSLTTQRINFLPGPGGLGAGGSEAGICVDSAYLQQIVALGCELSNAEFCHV